jgi:hypothetical protein
MKQLFISLIISVFCSTVFAQALPKTRVTDAEIKQMIIQDSIASYRGSCPCPYSIARNGSACGGRSAYSKPGGTSPICYANDISQQMVINYRNRFKM